MTARTWLITGVSSGFGRELTSQLLNRGDRVIGTVRDTSRIADLTGRYPDAFIPEMLEMTDSAAVQRLVDRAFEQVGRVDVVVSNAGYGLFGAAEELSDDQVEHIIATNLIGSITLIRAALPYLRHQGGGRIIQLPGDPREQVDHGLVRRAGAGGEPRSPPKSRPSASASPSSNRAGPAPSSATAVPASPTSCPNTTTPQRTPSSACSTPPTASPPATQPAWPPASSTPSTSNPHRYA